MDGLKFEILKPYIPLILEGVKNTLLLGILGVSLGVLLGFVAALMKRSKITVFRVIASVYIELTRGTPLMIQLFLIFYGIPQLTGVNIPKLLAAVAALGFNSGAYVAEIIRAGIEAVDKGQTEAAYSLGMNNSMTMRYIVIQQAIKNILPALVNEFITLIKESSVVSVIGLTELTRTSDMIRSVTYRPFEILLVVALIYFTMTFVLSKFMKRVERRLKRSDNC
jgi:polar amino acid transport system permease protein